MLRHQVPIALPLTSLQRSRVRDFGRLPSAALVSPGIDERNIHVHRVIRFTPTAALRISISGDQLRRSIDKQGVELARNSDSRVDSTARCAVGRRDRTQRVDEFGIP